MEDWEAFDRAVSCLPRELRMAALSLPQEVRERCEELHLRAGRGICWSDGQEEHLMLLSGKPLGVSGDDLRMMVELATRSSFHTAVEQLRRGFVTLPGGHRLGLTGTIAMSGGEVLNLLHISSVNLRIARARTGVGKAVLPQLVENGALHSTLILSPPGRGKTTLLRDLVRLCSDGSPGFRVGLVDERGEVAAMYQGVPQLDVGLRTDVAEGCPKDAGLLMLLRSMNPQILAVDEITAPEDVAALSSAAGCGVSLLATAHGLDRADLERRPLYRDLLRQRCFDRLVCIDVEQGVRRYRVEALT